MKPSPHSRLHALGRSAAWKWLHRSIKQSLRYGKTIPTDTLAYRVLAGVGEVPGMPALERALYRLLLDYPKKIDLFINTECQLRCRYCFVERHPAGKRLDEPMLHDLIEQAARLQVHVVQLLGGEPTLHPRLLDFVEAIVRRGMIAVVFSNGVALDENLLKRLSGFGEDVAVFYNYDHPAVFKAITGADCHAKVMQSIHTAKALGVHFGLFITLTKLNTPYLEALVEQALTLGVIPTMERYLPQLEHPDLAAELAIDAPTWKEARALMAKVCAKHHRLPAAKAAATFTGSGCPDYHDNLSILHSGEVLPCPFTSRSESLASIFEHSLAEVWDLFRARRATYHAIPAECSACTSLERCGGGCKTATFLTYGRYDRRDPLCTGEEDIPFKW